MSKIKTLTLTKDGVEYELSVEVDQGDMHIIEVTVLQGGIQKAETDIDPEEFEQKLLGHEWEEIREQI